MLPFARPLPNPLDHPLAVAAGSLLLVVLVRLAGVTPLLALPLALLTCGVLVLLRSRALPRSRLERLHDRRLEAGVDTALERAGGLAEQARSVRREAMARLVDSSLLEALGAVQLCCDRLEALPERLQQRRVLLESGGGVLAPLDELAARLAREQRALRQEPAGPLRQERQRLVEQLHSNYEAARLGMDEREARLLALATRLEAIDGGLRRLRRQIERQGPSSDAAAVPTAEATAEAMASAIGPLDGALDQIERLLAAG